MITALCALSLALAGGGYDAIFTADTLRVDLYHTGNATEEIFTVDRLLVEGPWPGSRTRLVDGFNLGRHFVKVYDAASGELLFSHGYDSYFGEYRTTDPAAKGIWATFQETVRFPLPKAKVRMVLEVRQKDQALKPVFTIEIDPDSIRVLRKPPEKGVTVIDALVSGDPSKKVDIAIIAEGYTAAEAPKFRKDLDRWMKVFFSQEPFKSLMKSFNVRGVFRPSQQSGCDEPSHGVYRQTAVGCSFDSLDSERYLLTEQNRRLRDVAGNVPYDTLCILVNHARYGGGGIYNQYCTFTSDNQWFSYLLLHEFGHSFAGLADEYYTSSTAYTEFYPKGVEPLEPNITALLPPGELKWKHLVQKGTEIPTPWEKDEFDRRDLAYQAKRKEFNDRIASLKRSGAPAAEVEKVQVESERLSKENSDRTDAYLQACKAWGVVGAFEGAGYTSRGMYRSMLDCIMFTKGAKPFCAVCWDAVARRVKALCE